MPDPFIQDLGMSDTAYVVVLPISVNPNKLGYITQFISAIAEQATRDSKESGKVDDCLGGHL